MPAVNGAEGSVNSAQAPDIGSRCNQDVEKVRRGEKKASSATSQECGTRSRQSIRARIWQCFDDLCPLDWEWDSEIVILGPDGNFSVTLPAASSVADLLQCAVCQFSEVHGFSPRVLASARLQTQRGMVLKRSARVFEIDTGEVFILHLRTTRGAYASRCECTVAALCGECQRGCLGSRVSHRPGFSAGGDGKRSVRYSQEVEVREFEVSQAEQVEVQEI